MSNHQARLSIIFRTVDDAAAFRRLIKKIHESEGTPSPLAVSIACEALRRAEIAATLPTLHDAFKAGWESSDYRRKNGYEPGMENAFQAWQTAQRLADQLK